jgi:thiamine biosynthesis lipoprotein
VTTFYSRRFAAMGTVVEIRVIGGQSHRARRSAENGLDAAAAWFDRVEQDCSRFDPSSELRRLCATTQQAVTVSPLLFTAVHFAIAVARETAGAFDPTVGAKLEELGFDRHHRTGERARSRGGPACWRDLELDQANQTIALTRPLTLDLGAVAKGLAIDLAARELGPLENFAIDAGGDLYLGGLNEEELEWSVGIRHPRDSDSPLDTVRISNRAVCTSGDYERPSPIAGEHHLIDPRSGRAPSGVLSVTAIGESAMVADALGTAAFVVGPAQGIELLERHGLEGMIVDDSLRRSLSAGWASLRV